MIITMKTMVHLIKTNWKGSSRKAVFFGVVMEFIVEGFKFLLQWIF